MNSYCKNAAASEGYVVACSFANLTSRFGPAVSVSKTSEDISIWFCVFESCVATGSTTSSVRPSICSGGSCYLDVICANLSNLNSRFCRANQFGHSIYIATSDEGNTRAYCLSDSLSGQEVTPYSSIYVFDNGNNSIKDMNISYPKGIAYPGALHLGVFPISYTIKFIRIEYSLSESSIAIAGSLKAGQKSTTEYCDFHKCSQDTHGILVFHTGNYFLNHVNIIDCSGIFDLWDRQVQSF